MNSNTDKGLVRSLGLGFVVVVLISNVIGSGVYKKVAPMADQLGSSGWVLIAWVLGGLVTLLGALSNAEVAGLLADTGGEFAYFKKIYNRFVSFMYGWANFSVIQTGAIAALAYVFAQSLSSIVDMPVTLVGLQDFSIGGIFYPFRDFTTKLIAIILILTLTIYNTRSVKSSANLNKIILWLVGIGLSVIVIAGLTSGKADLAQSFDFTVPVDKPITISALFTAMLAAFWAYQGWPSVGFLGGEIKEPHKNLPKGILIGTLSIIGIYLIVNVTYLAILSIDQLKSVHAAGNQIAAIEAIKMIWGRGGVVFISVLILVTTLGCTHATIYGSARPYYAMAKEGLFFKSMAKLNSSHVPGNVMWFQCTWACLLVFSGTFDQLTDMAVFAVFIFFAASAIGVFILRKKMPNAHRPYKAWGYPVVPALFILFCIGLLLNTIITQPREAFMGMILMSSGIPLYLWFNRKNKDTEQ
ncbi:MAG: amino acid permease [Saprospiraceae bacterium]|nr:amino acid permease [Saprospiraceae bacterium]